jgi:methionyl-tRNA formyltransferase
LYNKNKISVKEKLKIVFMGTPDFAVASLGKLLMHGYNIVGVVTATDKLGGRGGKQLLQSDVKKYAVAHNLNVLQPEKLKSKQFITELSALNADLFIVVAFRMLPEIVWSMPRLGTFNLHGSLLPKYRGAAPINWAIINGEKETGVTTFMLQHDIDTGAIIMQRALPIGEEDDFGSTYDKLKMVGADLIIDTVESIANGNVTFQPQDDNLACHAPKIFHETCEISFAQPAITVHNFIRGLAPYPGAHMDFYGEEMKVYKVTHEITSHSHEYGTIHTDKKKYIKIAVLDGYVALQDIKLEGKKRMAIQDFLNGYKWKD